MSRHFLTMVAGLALAAGGCPYNRYEIEMTPRGQMLERRLTVAKITGTQQAPTQPATAPATQAATSPAYTYGDFDPNELSEITKVYPKRVSSPKSQKHVFVGKFIERLPQDIGGSGWFHCYQTQMGAAYVYSELFRGNSDLCAELERRQGAADRLTDHLIGWMRRELRQEKGFDDLRAFLDKDLRQDIANLSLYDWAGNINRHYRKDPEQAGLEPIARIAHYLADRGYFEPEEVPRIVSELEDEPDGRHADLCARIQRYIAGKMGVSAQQPIPAFLAFLGDGQAAKASFEAYAQMTPEYAELLMQWNKRVRSDPNAAKPSGSEVLQPILEALFVLRWGVSHGGPDDEVLVTLRPEGEVVWSNGHEEPDGTVKWQYEVMEKPDRPDRDFPAHAYAVWVKPDEAFQKGHLGSIVLDGKSLLEYCFWRLALSDKDAREWDAMLAELTPGEGTLRVLEDFRFSDEPTTKPAPGQPPTHRAYPATQAIGTGLRQAREAASQSVLPDAHK
jgi:hypothetical protein